MGKNQARVEVMRAMTAWRKECSLGVGEVLNESEDDFMVEQEISAWVHVPAAQSTVPLATSGATPLEKSKKRKRTDFEGSVLQNISSQAVEVDAAEYKRQRKALKKERKRAAREMRKELKEKTAAVDPGRQMEDQNHSPTPLPGFSISERPVAEPAKQKKKKKFGPATSAYFAAPQFPAPSPKQRPPVKGDKPSRGNKRARKQERAATRMDSGATAAGSIRKPRTIEKRTMEADDVAMTSKPAALEATSMMQEVEAAFTNVDDAKPSEDQAVEVKEKKRKRARKRNQNRLPEETASGVENPTSAQIDKEAEKLPEDPKNDHNDIENEPKRKKTRRRKQPRREEPANHDEPPADSHEVEILVYNQDVKPPEQLDHSDQVRDNESIQAPSNKERRDRGRKPKVKQKEELEQAGHEVFHEEAVVKPLRELANTNTKLTEESRPERGRGRRRESEEQSEMDMGVLSSREQSKVRHS